MEFTEEQEKNILKQSNDILKGVPSLDVIRPCRPDDGIVQLTEDEKRNLKQRFKQLQKSISFFVPASGSGSRMFQFLYDYLDQKTETNQAQTEQFIRRLQSFAFYKQFPSELRKRVEDFSLTIEELIQFLLSPSGLNFGVYPKGLIPFHSMGPFILNPFQEQLIQGSTLVNAPVTFHFTIQGDFERHFQSSIQHLSSMTGDVYPVSYSEQDARTNSYAFEVNGNLAFDSDGNPIRRPAGHGTLLSNLSKLDSDYVLVKNIDNLQHYHKSQETNEQWCFLIGLLDEVKESFRQLKEEPSLVAFQRLNERFQFITEEECAKLSISDIPNIIHRPLRVCGMVLNEGQPGGGPFFVKQNGKIRKQIVEKVQLSNSDKMNSLLMQSTHFNPVMMALDFKDFEGKPFELADFKDDSAYFIVEKTYQGKSIRFIEQPGLWNGGMALWNTVFVEIPNDVFTPVKTVLDLLNPAHQAD